MFHCHHITVDTIVLPTDFKYYHPAKEVMSNDLSVVSYYNLLCIFVLNMSYIFTRSSLHQHMGPTSGGAQYLNGTCVRQSVAEISAMHKLS